MHLAMRLHLARVAAQKAQKPIRIRKSEPEQKTPAHPPVSRQVKPKIKDQTPTKLYKKHGDKYECLLCDRKLKTEKGIINHIEDKHPEE